MFQQEVILADGHVKRVVAEYKVDLLAGVEAVKTDELPGASEGLYGEPSEEPAVKEVLVEDAPVVIVKKGRNK